MILIDKYAYQSKLKPIDPMQKAIFALLALAVCLWANLGLVSLIVLLIMGGMTVIRGGIPLRFFLKLLLVPISFLLIGVFTVAVNITREPAGLLVSIPVANMWIGFSNTGLQGAGRLFMKALGAVSCLYFLTLSTPMVDLLAVFRRLRLPKLLIELMGLVYRFIFIFLETADTIYHAQNCRLGYASVRNGYRALGSLISVLFIRSYKCSDELFTALEARGYEGDIEVIDETYERYWMGYILAIVVNVLLILLAIMLKQVERGRLI